MGNPLPGYGHFVRIQCAAITRGCPAYLAFDPPPGLPAHHGTEVPDDERITRLLRMNGWRLDHGRWVCAAHPVRADAR